MATQNSTNTGRLSADGQLLIGSGSGNPVPANLTAGTNVTITNAAGSITINATGGNSVVAVSGTTQTIAANTTYITNAGASLITFTLPVTAAVGDTFTIIGKSAGLWTIAQNASQSIKFPSITSATGVGGSVAATVANNSITLVCVTANTTWVAQSWTGALTIA